MPDDTLCILLVEDNPADARLFREYLRESYPSGIKITHVERLNHALATVRERPFDVILLDLSLPDGDALETLLRMRTGAPNTPTVVLTGLNDQTLAMQALREGAQDYLVKGQMDGDLLVRAIRYACERSRVIEKLRESEARLATAQSIAQLGSWQEDLISGEVTWSGEICRMLGFNATDKMTPEKFLSAIPEGEHRHVVREALEGARREGRPYTLDHLVNRPDGSLGFMTQHAEVQQDASQRPIRIIGTLQDITERRRLEEQLRQAMKMEAVGRLAGGIAHDFNNLLTIILGYSDLLEQQLLPDVDQAFDIIAEIRTAGERAASLTSQLLAFSRKHIIQPKLLDVNVEIRGIEAMLRRTSSEDIDFRIVLDSTPRTVRADPGQFAQVLMNLAVNARDAMPHGGCLTIETGALECDAQVAQQHSMPCGRYVFIAVTDTGIGMDEETRNRIFEPFFTTKDTGKGTGLGLSTVYGIVEQSGGSISVYSEPGHGARITVYLPEICEETETVADGNVLLPSAAREGTVLLVDDNAGIRQLARTVLASAGYVVLEAKDPEEALHLASDNKTHFDLLLTDVVMPRMNGFELAAHVSKHCPHVRVLYTSGYTDHALLHRCNLAPENVFIHKPFTPAALLARIDRLFDTPKAQLSTMVPGSPMSTPV